jgi:hypothetical protein
MTITTNLGLTNLPSNSLQPDVPINADLAILDAAIAGTLTFNFTADANLTLTATQSQNAVILLSDTGPVLTVGRDVVFPAHFPSCYIKNSTAKILTLKKSGQAGIALAVGGDGIFVSGATDVVKGASVGAAGGVASAVTALAIAAGVVTTNWSLGNYFTLAATAAMTSFTFSGLPSAGQAETTMIAITQDATGSRVATFPASFKWAGGTVGILSTAANSKDLLALTTFDQGATYYATLSKAHS